MLASKLVFIANLITLLIAPSNLDIIILVSKLVRCVLFCCVFLTRHNDAAFLAVRCRTGCLYRQGFSL